MRNIRRRLTDAVTLGLLSLGYLALFYVLPWLLATGQTLPR